MEKDISIVIIEDNETLKSGGLIWELEDIYKAVHFFVKPDDGLKFIKDNLKELFIILLDISFPANEKNGHKILEEIRELSKNIPVILWSGINEYDETFSDFINNGANAYLKKDATTEEALKIINNVTITLKMSIDKAIEEWIEIQEKDERMKPYLITAKNGKTYTLNQILEEIRKQTPFGMEFAKDLNMLTIDLLLRGKKQF